MRDLKMDELEAVSGGLDHEPSRHWLDSTPTKYRAPASAFDLTWQAGGGDPQIAFTIVVGEKGEQTIVFPGQEAGELSGDNFNKDQEDLAKNLIPTSAAGVGIFAADVINAATGNTGPTIGELIFDKKSAD